MLVFAVLAGFFAVFPAAASAADPFQELCAKTPQAEACQGRSEQQSLQSNAIYGPNGIITRVTKLMSMAVGIAAVIVITIGGLQYVLSTGDPSKTAKAKNMILFAVVGIVIAVMAQSIVVFVLNKL